MKQYILYFLLLLAIPASLMGQFTVTGSNGADNTYTTLTGNTGAFTAINSFNQTGKSITITVTANSLAEPGTITLGAGLWTSLVIYPTLSGLTISGNVNNPLIGLNGSDNVTIDGRVNALPSNPADLTIVNTSTGTNGSTIRFINSAEDNIIQYCNLKGSVNSATRGIIFFATSTGGNGNDGNIIQYNNISGNGANRPRNAILSVGSSGFENSGNIISNNNIFNFFRNASASNGIFISTANTEWTISANNFYETTTFVPTANVAYYVIRINNTGDTYSVTDNNIGGSAPGCVGTWTKSISNNNVFFGIHITAGSAIPSIVENNTIKNFDWSNSTNGNWSAITIAGGDVNVGTGGANFIGSDTGTGSIKLTNTTSGGILYGINVLSTGTVDCSYNIIGSITAANINAANATSIYSIYKSGVLGTLTITNNQIGSSSVPNSINATSASTTGAQSVFGILTLGTGDITINDNTISNLTNGTTNTSTAVAGEMNGISSSAGINTVLRNLIYDLRNNNANNNTTTNASVCGISLSGTALKTVQGNTIYNLSNDYNAFAGSVMGIYFAGGTASTNIISENFIYSLSVNSGSTAASIYGVRIGSGTSTYYNNIISLEVNTQTNVYGIYASGAAGTTLNLWFNTIYLSGSAPSGTNTSYCLYNASTTNTRDYQNNIFVNNRSTTGGSNLHYAMYFPTAGGTINCRNNDYYVSGEGTTLGYYGAVKTILPIVTGQDFGSLVNNPAFALPGGTDPGDYVPSQNYLLGSAGTGITTDFASDPRDAIKPSMGAFEVPVIARVEVYKSAALVAAYSYLRDAFNDLNNGTLTNGDFEIWINESLTEDASAVLNASGSGSASYNSVTVFPTTTGIIIDGNFAAPLIDLNGADNVTIDGRVNGSGAPYALTLDNKSNSATTTTSAIRFINDATYDNIRYCNILGSGASSTGGIIIFATTTGTTGNDNNTIDNNSITASLAGKPVNAIYSAGTLNLQNSENSISNNKISDFLNPGAATPAGIYLAANNSSWNLSGNSFYETGSFAPVTSSSVYMIRIVSTTGSGFTISGNSMGGTAASCGGTAFTKTPANDNVFFGIYLNSGTGSVNSIQSNTIRNISWSNNTNADWTGIQVAGGDANIGTIATGNNIGSNTGTGSITLNNNGSNTIYGIYITSTGTVNIINNTIGSITANNNGSNASTIYCINKGATAGDIIINSNTIGSATTANSIYSTSAASSALQSVIGIYNGGTATVTINTNTIANLTNGTTNATGGTNGEACGISSANGTNTISGNIIHDISNGNANTNLTNNASVTGISLSATTTKTVTGNTIYNLSNNYASFTGGVIGIYFAGGTAGNTISQNYIYSLFANTAASASINGIRIGSGLSTYSNNIISLGGNDNSIYYGIFESGAAGNNNTVLFNTIYIGGTGASLTNRSHAFWSNAATNIRDFRNNVFMNARTTPGGSNLHYAIWLNSATTTNLTLDYNDYFVSGIGGVLGRLGGVNKIILPIIPSGDVNSYAINPTFATAGGPLATDYKVGQPFFAASGTGITTDYGLFTRINPTMGAWEAAVNAWKGTTSTSWNTGTNWTVNVPLGNNINLVFDNVVTSDLVLEADRTITNFTDPQSTKHLSTAGYKLTILGNLTLTGNGHINASASNSTVEFAGSQAQSIPAGTFYNDQVYNLTINNASNVSANGTIELLNTITATSGTLDAVTNSPTIGYGGTTAQTIGLNTYMNNQIYNLTIGNPAGVTLNSDFVVTNDLTINNGGLFTISAPRLLTVNGVVTNNAGNSGFVIRSDDDGNDAKLINNSISVPATVEFSFSGGQEEADFAYHYFVPPVQSMNFNNTDPSTVSTSFGLSNFGGSLLLFDETKGITARDQGWQYFDGWDNGFGTTTPFNNLSSTMGYCIYSTAADKMTFNGNLNGSSHTFNLSYTSTNADPGWNLIGNPFPCNYDLSGIDKLINTDDVDNTIYFLDGNLGVTYWNVLTGGTTGYSNIMPPMQGFFVIATQGTTLSFPATSKTPNAALPLRAKGSGINGYNSRGESVKKVKLVLNNDDLKDETIICLINNASLGYDGDYDAHKLFLGKKDDPFIFSELGSLSYAINAIPEPGATSKTVIPLTVKISKAGTYTLNASEFVNLEDYIVTLKHGAVETILSPGATYSFTSGTGTFKDFELIFGEKNSSSGLEKKTESNLIAWYSNNFIYINKSAQITADNCDITIYDMQGRKVMIRENIGLSAGSTVQIPVQLQKGIYMVYVTTNKKPFVSKIVVF